MRKALLVKTPLLVLGSQTPQAIALVGGPHPFECLSHNLNRFNGFLGMPVEVFENEIISPVEEDGCKERAL